MTLPRNRDLVLHLELLLERARRGEVQILITSSARLPLSPEGWGALEVEGYAAFGPLVPRLDEASLRGAFAKTLEGLAGAAGEANQGFEQLVARFAHGGQGPTVGTSGGYEVTVGDPGVQGPTVGDPGGSAGAPPRAPDPIGLAPVDIGAAVRALRAQCGNCGMWHDGTGCPSCATAVRSLGSGS